METKVMTNSFSLEEFVSRMVDEKGFGDEDPEVLEQIRNDLTERIESHINAAIINAIPENKKEILKKLKIFARNIFQLWKAWWLIRWKILQKFI